MHSSTYANLCLRAVVEWMVIVHPSFQLLLCGPDSRQFLEINAWLVPRKVDAPRECILNSAEISWERVRREVGFEYLCSTLYCYSCCVRYAAYRMHTFAFVCFLVLETKQQTFHGHQQVGTLRVGISCARSPRY